MKVYSIRNWDKIYENSRSRVVKDLAWVPVPNHHDGENFTVLMQHENAAEIFSAWVLMLQVASKCSPRGTLLRGNGQPHSDGTMSAKCRCPVTWFTLAFEYLEKHTDWLEVKELQQGDGRPSPSRHPSAEEGKGIERREGKGMRSNFSESPSLQEFADFCKSIHCGIAADWFIKDKFLAQDVKGWLEIKDWRKYALRVRGWWDNEGRPMAPKKNGAGTVRRLRDMNHDSSKE